MTSRASGRFASRLMRSTAALTLPLIDPIVLQALPTPTARELATTTLTTRAAAHALRRPR